MYTKNYENTDPFCEDFKIVRKGGEHLKNAMQPSLRYDIIICVKILE